MNDEHIKGKQLLLSQLGYRKANGMASRKQSIFNRVKSGKWLIDWFCDKVLLTVSGHRNKSIELFICYFIAVALFYVHTTCKYIGSVAGSRKFEINLNGYDIGTSQSCLNASFVINWCAELSLVLGWRGVGMKISLGNMIFMYTHSRTKWIIHVLSFYQ